VCLLAAAACALPVYMRPQLDELRPADAILVLGGVGKERYKYGLTLAAEGWAPTVVMSIPVYPRDPNESGPCRAAATRAKVLCFAPNPPTTKGEAQELHRLADRYGWRNVIVVTFRPHISRARYILEKCFDGNLIMAASPTHVSALQWAYQYLYQTAGYMRAALQPGC
jgi:uncharacterized SAM-binding protein YcdF (DUF218 family)